MKDQQTVLRINEKGDKNYAMLVIYKLKENLKERNTIKGTN